MKLMNIPDLPGNVLYDKQNPKIKNTIELMKSVLIEGLEGWLKNSCVEKDIYS